MKLAPWQYRRMRRKIFSRCGCPDFEKFRKALHKNKWLNEENKKHEKAK